jgi:hypothetical protein
MTVGIAVVLVSLLLYSAISGATNAYNKWFLAHAEVRGLLCGALWVLFMQGGYRAFREKYLPSTSSSSSRVGT